MLLKFKVANWRSIRDAQELSMFRAGPARRSIGDGDEWDPTISALAAIYGPNASGKSTLIDALRFMQFAVRESYRAWDPEGGTGRIPFYLNQDSHNEPSLFEIEFRDEDKTEYQYGFSIDDHSILTEYLYMYRRASKRRSVVFERGLADMGEDAWRFGPSFRGPAGRIKDTTRSNSLFLSAAAAAAGSSALSAVSRWLRNHMSIYDAPAYEIEHGVVARRIGEEPGFQKKLMAFLAHSDLGVSGIEVEGDESDDQVVDGSEGIERISVRAVYAGDVSDDDEESHLRLSHSNGSISMDLPFEWESDGTKALISFASIAIKALESGSVCVVDEIDTSLHPLLVAELVSVFADPITNPLQAQLIFTTHDVSLLRRWDHRAHGLEKDQVWLVEKGADGASTLVALLEYGRARKDENLARGYLTGRFGAIPSTSIALALLSAQSDGDDAE